jgi:hypothetical protein
MNETIGGVCSFVFALVVIFYAVVGATALHFDYRHFDGVAKECKERGHIQDNRTRIICSVEDK